MTLENLKINKFQYDTANTVSGSDWPKVSNQHGISVKNVTQKSTTKKIIFQ